MSTSTWTTTISGDWALPSNWSAAGVPNSTTATAIIPGAISGYTVTIAAAESEIVNAVTLGDLIGGNVGPTLDIAGTLTFAGSSPSLAFLSGTIQIASGGELAGQGTLGNSFGPGIGIVNNGTVLGNGGAGTDLFVLVPFTNNGTVLANDGQVGIEGTGFSNLSGTTLTGGSYIVQGPTAGTFNQIIFGVNFTANLVVDAANIVLDGAATDIQGFVGGGFQSIETQLQTIASNGTLQLLSGRGYSTTNALTDDGQLVLQGGTLATGGLSISSTGQLDGFGIVSGSVSDQGDIIANGGALYFPGAIGGSGTLTVTSGSSLILAGATPSAVANGGVIYDTGGLLDINALSGNGTLVVQNGATIDIGVATSESVVFSGSNAEAILGAPLLFTGTVAGFGLGDTLVLNGLTADTATVVNGNTLAVISSGTTVDTVRLSGNYTDATFSATTVGGNAIVTNVAGAPARNDMPFTVSLNDTAGLSGAQETAIVNNLSAAALDWGQYVTGHAPLRIELNITNTNGGSELANGGPGDFIATGQTIAGHAVSEPNSIYTLVTGNYDPNSSVTDEIVITLPADATALSQLFINPNPFTDPTATQAGKYDLLTVFRHEIAHGLGFIGVRDPSTGALGTNATLFDLDTQLTVNSGNTLTAANFVGANAEAAYGALLGKSATPVPLTILSNGEAYFHVANASTDPLGNDLMNGVGLSPGTSVDISPVDLAMLQDVGAPVTASVICFARGTRIATPRGEVAVERLAVGDTVLTLAGAAAPIVWIGVGRVLVTPGHRSAATPVIVRKGALADNVPHRDLRVTKGHSLYLDGALIPVEFLVNHRSILWDDRAREVSIYHIELATHDVLLADGAPAESYRDDGNRWLFSNANHSWDAAPQLPCAPILTGGAHVDRIWRQLLDRAGHRPGLPLTSDPDLHLLVDGKRLDATERRQETYVFRLSARPRSARICSRAGAPQELGLNRDPRVLGVAVRRIALVQRERETTIEADDARLVDGFHAFEAADAIRWTNGEAVVPDALFDAMTSSANLLLHLGGAMHYVDEGDRRQVA
jgi:hypothetical protein